MCKQTKLPVPPTINIAVCFVRLANGAPQPAGPDTYIYYMGHVLGVVPDTMYL